MTGLALEFVHPSACRCGGLGLVGVSAVGRARADMPTVTASRLASVITCPHCRDRSDLDTFLARGEGAVLPDGPGGAA